MGFVERVHTQRRALPSAVRVRLGLACMHAWRLGRTGDIRHSAGAVVECECDWDDAPQQLHVCDVPPSLLLLLDFEYALRCGMLLLLAVLSTMA